MAKHALDPASVEGTAADQAVKSGELTRAADGSWRDADDMIVLSGLHATLLGLMFPGFRSVTADMIAARFELS